MRAIIVRHYKTLNNVANEIIGWGDAPRAVNWQVDLGYVNEIFDKNNLRFTALYTSCLERSQQTGRYFATRRAIPLTRDIEALNEINYGSIIKKNKNWVAKNIPQHKTDPDYVYPKGESFRQMQDRSVEFLMSLNGKHRGQTILLVTHAGVIRGLVSYFLDLRLENNLKREISHRYIGDFKFENGHCILYDELGNSSGFVRDAVIKIPWTRSK